MSEQVTHTVYGGRATITFTGGKKHYYRVNVPSKGVVDLFQPSVTAIIGKLDKSAGLVPWAVDCMHDRLLQLAGEFDEFSAAELREMLKNAKDTWRDVKDKSANVGSVVHAVLEQELKARAGLVTHPKLPLIADSKLVKKYELDSVQIEQSNTAINSGFEFFDEHHIEIIEAEGIRWSPRYGFLGTGDLIARIDGDRAVLDYKTGKRLYPSVWLQLAAYQKAWEEEHPDQPLVKRVAVNVGRDGQLDVKYRGNNTLLGDFQAFLGLLRAWRWDVENTDYYPKQAPKIVGPLD